MQTLKINGAKVTISKADAKNKKYKAVVEKDDVKKTINFGDKRYEHYKD